ncbi:MAG: hypothetical protein C0485_16150 [Pirellula sp.]|nr:hypothetical protein [Pirellula sp.]
MQEAGWKGFLLAVIDGAVYLLRTRRGEWRPDILRGAIGVNRCGDQRRAMICNAVGVGEGFLRGDD